MSWIILVLLYGLLKGGREIAKKKAMEINTVMEVLFSYTLISFILVIPQAPKAGGLEVKFYFFIALKSFCMFLAWICSFNSLKHLPVSVFGVLSLSRVLFGTMMGLIFLKEAMGLFQIIGMLLVCAGLLLLKVTESRNRIAEKQENQTRVLFIILAFLSCIFNSISGFMDKILMKDITSSQLQFWYMLFIVIYYALYLVIKKEAFSLSVVKNIWVWILAVMFVIGDKALFMANGNPESKITLMTLIKQSACLVTIVGGKIFFGEKNITRKLLCASIIILGIFLASLSVNVFNR